MTRLQEFLNLPISQAGVMRKVMPGDMFGIELECEGRSVDWDGANADLLKSWAPHNDGSLRANHGSCCEWVFNGPATYKQSVERVGKLFEYFEKRKAKLVCSNRTSTHIHFNMGDKNVYQLVNMFILFTILEDLMDKYCGDDRNGNLFCLSSRHAEEQVKWVQDACFRDSRLNFRENWRYCSFNMASIHKFGSVEFRGMRGLDNKEDILNWLSIINEFCDYACYKMKNPVTLIEDISAKRPLGFLKEIFSRDNFLRLTKGIDENVIDHSIFEGLRLVQMLCYKIGTEFDQVRLRGRDFWASFSDNPEPVLDINPEAQGINPRLFGGAARGGRAARGLPPLRPLPHEDEALRVRRAADEAIFVQMGRARQPADVIPDAPAPDRPNPANVGAPPWHPNGFEGGRLDPFVRHAPAAPLPHEEREDDDF